KAHARWPSSSSVKAAAATSPNVTSATRSSARLTRAASSPTPPASMPSDRYGSARDEHAAQVEPHPARGGGGGGGARRCRRVRYVRIRHVHELHHLPGAELDARGERQRRRGACRDAERTGDGGVSLRERSGQRRH